MIRCLYARFLNRKFPSVIAVGHTGNERVPASKSLAIHTKARIVKSQVSRRLSRKDGYSVCMKC